MSWDRDGSLEEVVGSAGGVATAALSSIGCTELAVVPRSEAMCSSPICHATAKYSSPPVRTMRTCVAGCPSALRRGRDAHLGLQLHVLGDGGVVVGEVDLAPRGAAQPRVLGGGTIWCESNLEVAKLRVSSAEVSGCTVWEPVPRSIIVFIVASSVELVSRKTICAGSRSNGRISDESLAAPVKSS